MPRTIIIAGVATPLVHATRTIVPGDSFADILIALTIMSSLDDLMLQNRQVPYVFLLMMLSSLCPIDILLDLCCKSYQ